MSETTTIQYVPWKNLGQSGLKISNVIVGCMSFGKPNPVMPWVLEDEEEIFTVMKKAYDHGIRTFDTADIYSNGYSEILLGKFLKKFNIPRDKVVILTKVWGPVDESYGDGFAYFATHFTPEDEVNFQNNKGLSRRHILEAAENSVKRLGTYIDVYQIHRADPFTPMEETMKALNDVVEKGLVRYLGASSMKAVEFVEYQSVADKNGWQKFVSVQSYYNLLNREDEVELNHYANKHGVGIIPYSPLDGGVLAKPIPKDESEYTKRQASLASFGIPVISPTNPAHATDRAIIDRVGELAEKKKVSRASIATAWLIAKGAAPIVGLSSTKRVDDLVAGANLKLDEDEVKYLEEPYQTKKRFYL